MHYYKFNIADWNLGTAHLSLVEEAIYFRLINHYYDTESPIPLETQSVIRRLRMGLEADSVLLILEEFFTKTDKGYVHGRCEINIKEYKKQNRKNALNGAKGGRPSNGAASKVSQEEPTGLISETQNNPNHKPLTTNHKPLTILKDLAPPAEPTQKTKRATRLPEDWKPTDEYFQAAREIHPAMLDARIILIAQTFRDYWISKSGASATKNDWLATWRNWIRKESDTGQNPRSPPQAQFLTAREKSANRNAEIFNLDRARNF